MHSGQLAIHPLVPAVDRPTQDSKGGAFATRRPGMDARWNVLRIRIQRVADVTYQFGLLRSRFKVNPSIVGQLCPDITGKAALLGQR